MRVVIILMGNLTVFRMLQKAVPCFEAELLTDQEQFGDLVRYLQLFQQLLTQTKTTWPQSIVYQCSSKALDYFRISNCVWVSHKILTSVLLKHLTPTNYTKTRSTHPLTLTPLPRRLLSIHRLQSSSSPQPRLRLTSWLLNISLPLMNPPVCLLFLISRRTTGAPGILQWNRTFLSKTWTES